MDLRITSLNLRRFRNYPSYELEGIGDLEIFIGPNASGKTNILEAINLLTSTTSFRHAQISELIYADEDSSQIEMHVSDGVRELDVGLVMEPGKKKYSINGKAKPSIEVQGTVPVVTFTPDDLELAKKSSSVKRAEFDAIGSQITKNYRVIQRDFEKTLRYKNRLLKDEASSDLIGAINETLVTCATQLFCYRHALYRRMVPHIAEKYASISQSEEQFSASYEPSWIHLDEDDERQRLYDCENGEREFAKDEVRERIETALERFSADERARKRSLVGPHNDKIRFFLAGKDASSFASQGQQRSIVLAWKLAEVEIIRQTTGNHPVLLLDDVMSELDGRRRDMLVENVSNDVQTFITATDLSPFNEFLLEKARVTDVSKGKRQ